MQPVPQLPDVWRRVLAEYAAGLLDAEDVWHAVDDFAAGRLPEPGRLPVHSPDIADADELLLVQEQAARLDALLSRFVAGQLPPDDLAAEALDVLGLADEDGPGSAEA